MSIIVALAWIILFSNATRTGQTDGTTSLADFSSSCPGAEDPVENAEKKIAVEEPGDGLECRASSKVETAGNSSASGEAAEDFRAIHDGISAEDLDTQAGIEGRVSCENEDTRDGGNGFAHCGSLEIVAAGSQPENVVAVRKADDVSKQGKLGTVSDLEKVSGLSELEKADQLGEVEGCKLEAEGGSISTKSVEVIPSEEKQLLDGDARSVEEVQRDTGVTASEEEKQNAETGRAIKPRPNRVSRIPLEEYRKSVNLDLQRGPRCVSEDDSNVQVRHRLEHNGEKYNFAAASHGAKLVAANKEAKGATNILQKDKEKYYRSPCSAEDKFVVIELSEETLVDIFVVANFEFYSSNLKEFELLGSSSYPTEEWKSFGRFEAENARHAQSFRLPKPEWTRYLKLRMLSHYGSEFFCTLSMVEVYGIDAIECLLEEWLGTTGNAYQQETVRTNECEQTDEAIDTKMRRNTEGASRLGDSVLKVLMQKVKALEFNQSLFEQYIQDLDQDYKRLLVEFGHELVVAKKAVNEEISSSMSSLMAALSRTTDENEVRWERLQTKLSEHVEAQSAHIEFLRAQLLHMQNRETVTITIALFLILASSLSHVLARCLPWNEVSCLKFLLFAAGCLIATILSV